MKFAIFATWSDKSLFLLGLLLSVFLLPLIASAASPKPDCVLLVSTSAGIYAEAGESEVLQVSGDPLKIFWLSSNATKAENKNGSSVPLFGWTTKNPQSQTTYTYTFMNSTDSVDCSIVVHPVKGSINDSSLTSDSKTPTISGKATNLKEVELEIYKVGTKTLVQESGSVKVIGGSWKYKVDESLANGQYDVVLKANNDWKLNKITSGILSIGKIVEPQGTLVVARIPLLIGGVAHAGNAVSLSYLQVINVSNDTARIKGITIKQNGSDSTGSIVGLKIVDDTDAVLANIDEVGEEVEFKNGSFTIPLNFSLKPKEMRLLTVKADIANSISQYLGDQLKIEVTKIDSGASIKGTFPIRGTTWTIGN